MQGKDGSCLLLFDFDGVLADSLDFYERAVRQCLDRIGQPVLQSREDFLSLYEDNFYEALVQRGVDLSAFLHAGRDIFPAYGDGDIRPFGGFSPVLAALAGRHALVVVSSSGAGTIRSCLARFGLAEFFPEVMGAESGLSKKDKIARALETYGVPAEKTWYIGDTAGDIREARQAGICTVAVTWGWHDRERLRRAGPDRFAATPEDLLRIGNPRARKDAS